MVQKWFTEFRCGRTSTETLPSPGRLNTVTTLEMIYKIRDMVLGNMKLKKLEIDKTVCISNKLVYNILHKHLQLRKLCARLVPRSLTIDQKGIRVSNSEQSLAYFNRNPK